MGGCRRDARGEATWRDPEVPTTRAVGTGTRRARDMLARDAVGTTARRMKTDESMWCAKSTRTTRGWTWRREAGGGDVVVIAKRPPLVVSVRMMVLARSAHRFYLASNCARRRVDDRLARRAHTSSRRVRTASRVYRSSASFVARAIERHGASDGRVRVPAVIRIPARGSRVLRRITILRPPTEFSPSPTPRARLTTALRTSAQTRPRRRHALASHQTPPPAYSSDVRPARVRSIPSPPLGLRPEREPGQQLRALVRDCARGRASPALLRPSSRPRPARPARTLARVGLPDAPRASPVSSRPLTSRPSPFPSSQARASRGTQRTPRAAAR